MPTKRSRAGKGGGEPRKHVGLTLPRPVKAWLLEAGEVLDWSAGDVVLAAAAEHGGRLREALDGREVPRRPRVEDPAFTALYLTAEEREELDELAVACRLNRSAFVTAVSKLHRGDEMAGVVADLGLRDLDHRTPHDA